MADAAPEPAAADVALRKAAHRALRDVESDIEQLAFNRAVARIYELVNTINRLLDGGAPLSRPALEEAGRFLVLIGAPMMPHLAEECWQVLGQSGLISEANWPQIERDLLVEDTVTLVVQVNGKKRGDVTVPRVAQNPEIEAAVLALDAVKLALGGKPVRKVIVVPMRIVNVVG
jgi:leucyl-tRNA synthetase